MTDTAAIVDHSLAGIFTRHLALVEHDILHLVRAMPEEAFGFRPAGQTGADARTFEEQAKHVATVIYLTAAIVRQERSPYAPGLGNNGPLSVQGKPAVLDYVEGAFAYARTAVSALAGPEAMTPLKTYFGIQPRVEVAAGIVYHSYNHYGQMVVYARLNGVAPSQP